MPPPSESPKITKDKTILTSQTYNTPQTSLLIFRFEPTLFSSSDARLRTCSIIHHSIEGKDLYIFDKFFSEAESQEMRTFSTKKEFGKTIFAVHESREKGEESAQALSSKEKWELFSHPPNALVELYKLLATLAERLNADITTLPWELRDQNISVPAVATNRVESLSSASMELGKHQDYNTETGIPFGIPLLYSQEKAFHPNTFINGSIGKPWLVSLMLYSTDEQFLPEYGLGTVYYTKDAVQAAKSECTHMRFVLFEGDILHSIEHSSLPPNVTTWRVSYVFKLAINPRQEGQCLKKAFYELMRSYKNTL